MQMIMIIKVVCAIMKLKMLFSKRGLKVFWQTWWPWKCRKQKHDWKFSGSLLKPTLQLSQRQQSLRWHFKLSDHWTFFFLSDRSDRNNHRKPGFSQFECRLNKNQASMVIVKFKCFSFVFFWYAHPCFSRTFS